ncbi:Major facilitator superfamily [Macrophomina phaseolina MS6]|uniref:Major facilitator superfamily n=1 Tax=Macrophomina phaseolina (strain MS6) TaxID=1126212 RepID=K2SHD3_MACPH|nr:Major facilitator superfamily [Macrophomina phaseolina MS6]
MVGVEIAHQQRAVLGPGSQPGLYDRDSDSCQRRCDGPNWRRSIGSIILAAAATARSYKFMIFGVVVQSFGDIATKVAQYKAFCSWFSPSHGFASTIGIEHGISKLGSFVGKATANVIAERTGDFSWVYWTAVFVNLFTNVVTLVYWLFARWCGKRYSGVTDPATGDKLPENNKKFEVEKMIRLPWPFWGIVFFSLFQTCAAAIYSQNATEMAEQRFHIDPVKAGWYSAMSKYLGFFLAPMLGIFVDLFGQRLTVMLVCGVGMLLSMSLLAWGPSISGTAASFGFYAVSYPLGPTVLIDSVRTSIWYPEIFGSGYAVKVAVNNSMIIIVRIITGVIQDRDNNTYNHVVIVYVLLAAGSVVVGAALFALSFYQVDLRRLQWTKTQRLANGDLMNERREAFKTGDEGRRNRRISLACFAFVLLLIATAWVAFFWGVATGNND